MKHTPGPWFVASGNNYATEITATSKRGKKWVIARATASKTGQEEAKANARLIAAAPDYDLAARELIERHDNAAKRANFQFCGCDDCKPFRVIIAKAESST